MRKSNHIETKFVLGNIWREPKMGEPWRVMVEDCDLGFKTEDQAREFASRHFAKNSAAPG